MSNIKEVVIHEVKKTLLVTLYFAVGFNLLVLLVGLLVDSVELKVGYFGAATFSAALTGKVVVLLETVGIDLKLKRTKLINVVILKAVLFTVVIFLAIVIEDILKGMIADDLTFSEALHHVIASFNSHFFLARCIYMFMLFALYHFIFEVDKFLGTTELFDMVFSRFFNQKDREYIMLSLRWNFQSDSLEDHIKITQEFTHKINQVLPKYKGTISSYEIDGIMCLWENSDSKDFMTKAKEFFKETQKLDGKYGVVNIRGAIKKGIISEAEVGGFLKKEILRISPILVEVNAASKLESGLPLKEL
ncbi:hypothetical protein [Flammeovirga kamogawensis]|uniref:Adenylate/guanylate cyclase domain-containing protein n=1 Tax=Flammeovirga kamogawensis TaxID=373891 RepID=A0ABX8GW27_9BACT|nr:hypothetical protein [Flammeovirga kamogawensis]MBB6461551.1 hypothetical protein [Flammeovirga kamogawensis]QWG07517.1 hypothetical protein KM029_00855 [Flammeovirga kamogawensis]TRX69330.1 hypothetical protein EO216_14800 [Flammeovirga kamogawensis]